MKLRHARRVPRADAIESSPEGQVFLNGRFAAVSRAKIPVFDRGFLYGDGLFESVRVHRGRPFLFERHLRRLREGARWLRLDLPFTDGELRRVAAELLRRNHAPESVLRLQVSRGTGSRGYSIEGANSPTTVMSVHPVKSTRGIRLRGWRLITSSHRVQAGTATLIKSSNKLLQVLARVEAGKQNADEALLLNASGAIAEAASANVFWIEGGAVITPPVSAGALRGITREFVLELCGELGLGTREETGPADRLLEADGSFLTLSSLGIVEAAALDGAKLRRSPIVRRIWTAYRAALDRASRGAADRPD